MTLKQDPNDKYKEYEVDFHGLVDHEENETTDSEGKVNDWHERHKDKVLDVFCDTHPDAPQCRVYDD